MWNKPPIFLLVWLGVITLFFLYRLVRFYFYADKEYEDMVKKNNETPNWYSLKDFSNNVLSDKESWIKTTKKLMLLGVLFILGLDTLFIIAFLIGK